MQTQRCRLCTLRRAGIKRWSSVKFAMSLPARFWSQRFTVAVELWTCWWATPYPGFVRSTMAASLELTTQIETRLLARNQVLEAFFDSEARHLSEACRQMSQRFLRGGRLLAFGRGPYATDAQHVLVEFVHPVIVGKRALPALDLSILFGPWLRAIVKPEDIVMGFGPPEGDPEVQSEIGRA